MISRIIELCIKQRIYVVLMAVALLLAGIYALRTTAVDAIPDLSDVQVIIRTPYPGQAPSVVQDQVTYPLTSALLAVPKSKTVRGYSFYGDSYVYVIFDEGTDLYWARSRVLEYLNQVSAQLPPEARPALGPDATGVGWVFSYALLDKSGKQDLADLRTLQDWFLKYELQSLPGVAEVATVGGYVKQYQVQIDPQKLRQLGMPLSHVITSIQKANGEAGASVIDISEAEYMVRATGYLQSVADFNLIPLGTDARGKSLLLSDVAHIQVGAQMRRGIAELNGEGEVVGGTIVMRQGENAPQVIAQVKTRLDELRSSLPAGVEIITTYDRSALIQRAVDNLFNKISEELLTVVLVCAAFLLHLRSSLVVLITLPLGVLSAFLLMRLQGINANIMSLGGIAIAIGAMVDGAIVMVENLHKHMEHNPQQDHWQRVQAAASEVGKPLFFALSIITVSFIPVFALQAQEGKLFSPLAFTKTYAMGAAAILAITLVPVVMGYLIRGKVPNEQHNPLNRFLNACYQPVLSWVLTHPLKTLSAGILLLGISLWPLSKIGSEFMPALNEGDLMYMPTTYAGISIGKAQEILQQTDKLIKTIPEVESVFGKIGRSDSATDPAPLTMIETLVQLKPQAEWRAGLTHKQLRAELEKTVKLPGLSNAWVMPIKTRIDMLSTGIKTPVGIKIAGNDFNTLQKIGSDIESILSPLPGTASVYSEKVAAGRYMLIDINRAKAARYNLSIADIQAVIKTAIGGSSIGNTIEGQARYSIQVRYPQSYRDNEYSLQNLPLITASGQKLRLADVADVRIEAGPPMIKSENSRINAWVLIDLQDIDIGTYVANAQQLLAEKLQLPAGYSIQWSGQYEYMQRAKQRLSILIPITLAIITLLLAMSFNTWRPVVLIMAALPFAAIGGIWLMSLLHYTFSVAVAVGFIALLGVAVEIGIILLNQFETLRRQHGHIDNQHMILAAQSRVRPIMMTTLTVVIGLVPVMWGDGTGSEVMQRIAAPMVGGMLSALILNLILLPAAYRLWHK
ncbi:MAG: efflux RND transporter permease subunit [Oceanospirillaceae bacterium]|nr:efflux RND transporter permease subunit [Oceanospirillaceae bacterium]